MSKPKAVLLLAYGTPRSLDEVEPFYLDIRRGRPPTPAQLADLQMRYRRVGGRTPLLEITQAVGEQLEARLQEADGGEWRVFCGMKHWHPYIAQAVAEIAAADVSELIVLPMMPHYSSVHLAEYVQLLDAALLEHPTVPAPTIIQSWHANPQFVEAIADRIRDALQQLETPQDQLEIIFSAHSLPQHIQEQGDPYPQELLMSAANVAEAAALPQWQFAYQSAGRTPFPWLGPDILESIEAAALHGKRHILSVPFGFVCDHLEVLYDIDIEAAQRANANGLTLTRIEMPNAAPDFVEALRQTIQQGTGTQTTPPPP